MIAFEYKRFEKFGVVDFRSKKDYTRFVSNYNFHLIFIGRPKTIQDGVNDYASKSQKIEKIKELPLSYLLSALKDKLKDNDNTFSKNLLAILEDPNQMVLKFPEPMNEEETTCLIIDTRMTRDSFQQLRNISLQKNNKLFPTYKKVSFFE